MIKATIHLEVRFTNLCIPNRIAVKNKTKLRGLPGLIGRKSIIGRNYSTLLLEKVRTKINGNIGRLVL